MPHAITAHYGSKLKRIFFERDGAQLPVLRKDGNVTWLPWGARTIEVTKLPHARIARLSDIRAQKWRAYHPHPCTFLQKISWS